MEGRDAPLWRCPRLPSPEARSPPRRADWAVRIQVPVREGGAGSSSSAAAHRGAPTAPLAPGRAVRSKPWGSIRGGRESQGRRPRLRPIRAPPSGRPSRPGCSVVDIVGVPLRTRIGSELEGLPAQRGCAGGSVDAAARGAVATPVPFAPSVSARARAVRWRNDPATQKGGRRGSFTLRPALLPSRSGAMTPFLMSAGAAAHLKDMRRPPFSTPPTPRAATAGPPEASTAPGPSSTPARTATAGVASRSPRGNHRTAPGPARISRIRPARPRP